MGETARRIIAPPVAEATRGVPHPSDTDAPRASSPFEGAFLSRPTPGVLPSDAPPPGAMPDSRLMRAAAMAASGATIVDVAVFALLSLAGGPAEGAQAR